MTPIYRILRKSFARNPFDGEGAYLFGGRWSSPGTRLSYASEHQSLAMLEYFVHLDKDDPPDDLVLAIAEVPEAIKRETLKVASLPSNWRDPAAPPALTRSLRRRIRPQSATLLIGCAFSPRSRRKQLSHQSRSHRLPENHRARPETLNYDPRLFPKRRGRPH